MLRQSVDQLEQSGMTSQENWMIEWWGKGNRTVVDGRTRDIDGSSSGSKVVVVVIEPASRGNGSSTAVGGILV